MSRMNEEWLAREQEQFSAQVPHDSGCEDQNKIRCLASEAICVLYDRRNSSQLRLLACQIDRSLQELGKTSAATDADDIVLAIKTGWPGFAVADAIVSRIESMISCKRAVEERIE